MKDVISSVGNSELILWLLRRRRRFRVTGNSMLPLFRPGEEILVDPYAYKKSLPKIDDIVIAVHPLNPQLTIVKRITAIDYQGRYFLAGDNPEESTDSRHWGTIDRKKITGIVTAYFS